MGIWSNLFRRGRQLTYADAEALWDIFQANKSLEEYLAHPSATVTTELLCVTIADARNGWRCVFIPEIATKLGAKNSRTDVDRTVLAHALGYSRIDEAEGMTYMMEPSRCTVLACTNMPLPLLAHIGSLKTSSGTPRTSEQTEALRDLWGKPCYAVFLPPLQHRTGASDA